MLTRRKRWWALLAAAIVLGAAVVVALANRHSDTAASGGGGDLTCRPSGTPRATLMLLHPGGFVEGRARDMAGECHEFARHGYLTVSIDYPHRFFPALRDLRERARGLRAEAHGPLFAYGLSAGGSYAALLAERGDVDAAFSYAGVYDIGAWAAPNPRLIPAMGTTRSQLDRASPVAQPLLHPSPLLIAHNPADIVAPYRDAVRLSRRSPQFRLRTYRRPANGYAAHILHPVTPALEYFSRHLRAR